MPVFTSGNINLSYTLEGNLEASETVILLHGELADSSSWVHTIKALEAKYRILSYNRLPKPGMNLENHLEELVALVNDLELGAYHVVGHSGGGILAYRLAAKFPTRILSLVLADSLGRLDAVLEIKIRSVLEALNSGGSALAFMVAMPWLWGAHYLEYSRDHFEHLKTLAASSDPAPTRIALESILQFGDQRKYLRAIECPVLVMVGSDDNLTPMRYSHEIVEWVKPGLGVLVTVSGGGHNAPLECPDEFNRVLAGFLTRYQDFKAGNGFDDDSDDNIEDDGAEYHDFNELEN
jgi:3-oxoadipate enol-lactonase